MFFIRVSSAGSTERVFLLSSSDKLVLKFCLTLHLGGCARRIQVAAAWALAALDGPCGARCRHGSAETGGEHQEKPRFHEAHTRCLW